MRHVVHTLFILCFHHFYEKQVLANRLHQLWFREPTQESQSTHSCILSCFSHVQLFVTLWTVACQTPLSMGFSSKNTGVGCHALLQSRAHSKPQNLKLIDTWNSYFKNNFNGIFESCSICHHYLKVSKFILDSNFVSGFTYIFLFLHRYYR